MPRGFVLVRCVMCEEEGGKIVGDVFMLYGNVWGNMEKRC